MSFSCPALLSFLFLFTFVYAKSSFPTMLPLVIGTTMEAPIPSHSTKEHFLPSHSTEEDFLPSHSTKEHFLPSHSTEDLFLSSLEISKEFQSARLRTIPDFITSTSIDTNYLEEEAQLQQLNITNCRVYCMWRYLTPSLSEIESFSVEELRENTEWIEPYSASLSWNQTDYQVQQLLASGIDPIIEIGEGTDHCLPTVSASFNSSSGVADPETVGEQQYLAYMYRYCRAVVHRYKENVTIWQIENELNDAYLQAVGGLRSPRNPFSTPWGNFTYVTQVIQTIYLAVKDEDPTLWTTQNVVADIPHDAYQIGRFPEYYLDAVKAWEPILDMISFDVYPNYFIAYPVYGEMLVSVTENIRSVLRDPTKPIMVAETGTHVMDQSSLDQVTLHQMNCTGQSQADFLASSFVQTYAAGIKGYQVFKLSTNSGFVGASGGYTNKDIKFLQACTDSVVQDTLQPLFDYLLSLRDISYLLSGRAAEVLEAPTTTSFGILDAQGNPLPSFTALHDLYSSLPLSQ